MGATSSAPVTGRGIAVLLAVVVSSVLLLSGGRAAAQSPGDGITWILEDVTFDTGATASGSFRFDATTNTYSNFDITVTGSPVNGAANTYRFINPSSRGNADFMSAVTSSEPDLTGARVIGLTFDTPLTDAGGVVDIRIASSSFQANCATANCSPPQGPIDFTQTGRVATADTTAPDTTITSGPTDPNLLVGSFVFTGNDDRSGPLTFECRFNGGPYEACTSPYEAEIPVTLLQGAPPFVFPVDIRAIDAAGNVDPSPARYDWSVDPQPGFINITVDTVPDGPQDFVFDISYVSDPNLPGQLPATIILDDDDDETRSNVFRSDTLREGSYTFSQPPVAGYTTEIDCAETDAVNSPTTISGNTVVVGLNFGETVDCTVTNTLDPDTVAPVATPTTDPAANANGWNNTDVTVTWNWADEAGTVRSGIDPANCEQTTTSSGEGSIDITATCADLAGNVGTARVSVEVDQTAPDSTITAGPPATSVTADATFDFFAADTGSGVAGLECQVDGSGFAPCTSPVSLIGLANGGHTFEVRAVDIADNVEPTPVSFTWTVDVPPADATPPAAAPTLAPAANDAGWHDADVTATWNWTDEGSGVDPANCTTTSTSTGEGDIELTAECADLAGNTGAASVTVRVDTTAPTVALTSTPPATSISDAATFEFSGSDTGSGVAQFECQLDGGGFGPCSSPLPLAGLAEGPHTLDIRAADVAGNTGSAASYTWTVLMPAVPFAVCGGFEVFETSPGVYEAPGFAGNLIVGTDGRDVLAGTDDPDLILGLRGADSIWGRGAVDVICGGRGADIINGGGDDDRLHGQAGADIVNGNGGDDLLFGGGAGDILNGGRGRDVVYGGAGADELRGGRGNDDLFGQGGPDWIDGGRGRDACNGGGGIDAAVRCEQHVSIEVS